MKNDRKNRPHDTNLNEVLQLFVYTLQKRENEGLICVKRQDRHEVNCSNETCAILENLDGYHIFKEEREMEFKLVWVDECRLQFASIGETVKIGIDFSKQNSAGEWDVIELNTRYLITKTLSSFFNNKVWAWIDRRRTIWKEELY